jgi:hypothetical protein
MSKPRIAWRTRAGGAVLAFAAAILACASLLVSEACAQSLLEFDRWMQKIETRSLSMQRNLKRNDGDAATADAREIQALYKLMEDYFDKRGDAHAAVKLSREGGELAEKVVRSATTRDFDRALGAAITLARACRDCHQDYKPLD